MTMDMPTSQAAEISSPANLREFLDWLGARPRTYAETMDAWRTHCPRQTIWEDAVDHGLVAVEPCRGKSRNDEPVVLTDSGRAWLHAVNRVDSGSA